MVVALVAAGMGTGIAIAATRNDTPTESDTAAQVAGVGQACRQWMDSSGRDDDIGCAGMTQWMDQRLTDGDMTGSMMWGDADRMLSTCRSSTQASAPASDASLDWCAEMVDWMRQRMGASWGDDWMMDDSMMDGSMMPGG